MAASAALLGTAGAANAEVAFSGNVALTTDYVFRGISQTLENPAIQGGFDVAVDKFYAGVWASNVDFGFDETIEIDLYGGVKPELGPVTFDFGVLWYTYPGAADDGAEYDYLEGKAAASFSPTEPLTLGAAFYYSPEFFGETGSAYYIEGNAGFAVNEALALGGAIGYQDIEEGIYGEEGYTTWNLGAAYSLAGFTFDARYFDTSFEDDIAEPVGADSRVVLTVKRAL